MKSFFSKLAERYQGKKFYTSLFVSGVGVYLISQGHVEAGTALLGASQGTFNIGQGLADAKKAAVEAAIASAVKSATTPVAGQN